MKFTNNLLTSTLFITLATSSPLHFPSLSLTHRTTDTLPVREFPEIQAITDRDSSATVPTTDGKGNGKDYGAGAKCYRDADGNGCGFKCHRAVETDGKGGKGGKKCYRDVTPGVAGLATDGWGAGCGLCYRDISFTPETEVTETVETRDVDVDADAGTAKVDTADDHDDDDDDDTADTAGKKCYRDTDTATTSTDGNWGGNGGGCGGKCCGNGCGKDCGKNVIAKYGQCGGANWNGAGSCESGSYCKYQNEWYSQCV